MPPRLESELDPVTLHNMALLTADANPSGSFDKLQFLLQQQVAQMAQESGDSTSGPSACPPETFTNLLLLYCKYEYYDMAADLLAEHADLTYKHLSAVKRQFTNTRNCDQVLFTFSSTCTTFSRRSSRSKHLLKRLLPNSMHLAFDTAMWYVVQVLV